MIASQQFWQAGLTGLQPSTRDHALSQYFIPLPHSECVKRISLGSSSGYGDGDGDGDGALPFALPFALPLAIPLAILKF